MKANDDHSEHEAAWLSRLLPDLAERDLPAGRHSILKEHLMSEIRLAPAGRPAGDPAPGRRPPSRRRARVVLAAGVSAVVVAGAVATAVIAGLSPAGSGGHPGPGQPARASAVQLLAKIAAVAGRQRVPAVRDGQFEYIRSEVAFISTSVTIGPGGKPKSHTHLAKVHQRQIWYSVSDLCRTGLLRENRQNTVLREAASPGMPCPHGGSLNDPTYRFLQSLPTQPQALLKLIYTQERGHGPSPADEAFTTIGDLLGESIAPPRISAALFRAAALIPGVTVVHHVDDAVGRRGVAVAFTYGGLRSEWIFSSRTLRMIGERDVSVRTGAIYGVSAILDRAFVSRPGQVPAGS